MAFTCLKVYVIAKAWFTHECKWKHKGKCKCKQSSHAMQMQIQENARLSYIGICVQQSQWLVSNAQALTACIHFQDGGQGYDLPIALIACACICTVHTSCKHKKRKQFPFLALEDLYTLVGLAAINGGDLRSCCRIFSSSVHCSFAFLYVL